MAEIRKMADKIECCILKSHMSLTCDELNPLINAASSVVWYKHGSKSKIMVTPGSLQIRSHTLQISSASLYLLIGKGFHMVPHLF